MSYSVELSPDAAKDLAKLRKSEPKAFEKALTLLDELAVHPRTGTGKTRVSISLCDVLLRACA
ncbi:MAG: hypothetical protein IJ795_03760 [Bacteroidales bacterium]|nr:hypothetical protein [Bacteroidales bacterium]